MRPVRHALLLVLAAASLLGVGCKGKCRVLSENLCECSESSLDRDACLRRAASEESRLSPTEAQEDACETFIDTCDCTQVGSLQGKQACGLAR
jgi:hypothetical protein